ncbi:hypothetical protein ANOM_007005 [Aspergillus nomiae NRRL 13137]|uniref:SP-RING-type domain-containing protein n=1 Tax=Aspergillus nomiae NRRL (strain ATCC 15546 / NRRL 13137 / CBS 260.88 / M93) TaxID=1509407 RepID=A0A0L1IXQ6_ASPN3|nr:uncharacterized protein ANOM_007005 [Aspergillus nomiae NRRL 13137]KNG84200.1 hypothetical protein ANOM_007005 [Aspergillus nomiae NRRL 13137]
MSPTPHLPNVNSNPNSVESSNSTANIFLGGVRRSWMLNAANCPSSFSCHSKIPDDSAAATSSNNAVAVSAAADAAAAAGRTRQQGMRESSSLRVLPVPSPSQENAASITTAVAVPSQSPSQPNVISPVTTGHAQQQFQQHSPVSRGSQWHVVSDRAGPDPPLAVTAATTTQSVPIASLQNPIEVPSPICDSSSTVVNRNGASPSVTAFPSPRTVGPAPLRHQPQAGTAVSTSSPAGVGAGNPSRAGRHRERSNTSLQPQRQGSHASHSHSPVLSPAFPSSAAFPRLQMVQPPNASRRNPSHDPILDDAFYERSLKTLEIFQEQLKQRDCLGNVEQPRTQLLYQACAERDPLFLAIHQVYCLHSLAPQEFLQLPGYTVLQEYGLDVIRRLLVENNRVSAGFLRWSTQFPAPLVGLMQRSRYRQVVEQAGQCLRLLAERWPMYVKDVRKREFPPLVDELVKNFEITSGALAYTIFLSTCRTLPGSRSEEHLKAVWELDLRYYQQRCASPRPVSNAQLYEEHQKVIQAYRSVSVPTGTHQPGPHPTLSHGSTSIGSERDPMVHSVARPTSTGGPQIRNPQMMLPLPSQTGPLASQGTMNTHSHPLPVVMMASRGSSVPHSGARSSGTPIPQPINPEVASPTSCQFLPPPARMPANAPGSHPSAPVVHSRRSSWTNGAPTTQHTYTLQVSDPMSRATGAPAQAAALPMVYPSQIAHPLPGGRIPPMQLAVQVPRQVATRPPQLEVRNNEVGPSMQPMNLRHQTQPPQSPVSQQRPHPRPPPTLLLPLPGSHPLNTIPPQPLRDALHQAHLREPHNYLLSRGPAGEKEMELYQYLSSFAVPPTPLGREQCAFHWRFTLSKDNLDQFPKSHSAGIGQRSFRFYSSGNRVYRLRCIKMPSVANEVAESMWSVAESVWPSVFYVHVNGVELFVRRRVHNGKDLPLDITDHLIEGDNMISLHFIRSPAEANDMLYAMAVEVLEISDLVRAFSLAQALSPSECREQICQRVSSSLQDDEVSVVSDHLSINLVDPFTARIFSRPVRGRSCKHQDCFDHLTWIQTRASKSGKRSLKNDWKCPICGQDARPQQLVIDGYLQEVRAELARINLLEGAKAILIKADGSWELKSESDARPSECGPDNTGERVPSKRKASETSNYSPAPATQRPKFERTNSAKGPVCNAHPPEVIALD